VSDCCILYLTKPSRIIGVREVVLAVRQCRTVVSTIVIAARQRRSQPAKEAEGQKEELEEGKELEEERTEIEGLKKERKRKQK
jgi:hypothetical protein